MCNKDFGCINLNAACSDFSMQRNVAYSSCYASSQSLSIRFKPFLHVAMLCCNYKQLRQAKAHAARPDVPIANQM